MAGITTTITTDDIRDWLGLKTTDPPADATITKHINWSLEWIELDADTTDSDEIDMLVLLKCGSRLLKWLAIRAVKNGYVSFNSGGVNINKSPRELMELANDMDNDYWLFVAKTTSDVVTTKFLEDLDTSTQQDIKEIFQSTANVWDYQAKYHPSVSDRSGRYS